MTRPGDQPGVDRPSPDRGRLADLAVHMETVTQKYLRNEYATIEEYNAVAEEVAEPYRVLVVADFPSKFDEKSAVHLAAIAAGGVPCGVIIWSPPTVRIPFRPASISMSCAPLQPPHLERGRVSSGMIAISAGTPFPGSPPPADFATRQIQKIGAAARDAKRVEVAFEFIAPLMERSGLAIAAAE